MPGTIPSGPAICLQAWTEQVELAAMQATGLEEAVEVMNKAVKQQVQKLQDPHHAMPPTGLHSDPVWKKGNGNMWEQDRAIRCIRGTSLLHVWKAWRHLAAFRKQSKKFRKEASLRRRQLVDEFLQKAHECSLRKDPAQWYQRIRKLCPANQREGIHLRSKEGALLSPQHSIEVFKQLYTELFVAPTVVWKHMANSLAKHIHAQLQECWCSQQQCYLSEIWHRGFLCLLPPKTPRNLRLICIQHPVCKILTGLTTDKARAESSLVPANPLLWILKQ